MQIRHILAGLCCLAALSQPAFAKVLEVGEGKAYSKLAEAAGAAQPGDTIHISDGEYFDCGVFRRDNLIIEGSSEAGTVLTDKACEGKALLVLGGSGITVRNLTLTRARVPDGNGAGIRAEGGDLLIDHVKFVNNQNGILSADGTAKITVRDSEFDRNGVCDQYCSHGIYAGHIALLRVEHSVFRETKQGHHIKSRAMRTEVINCDLADGQNGTSSYVVDVPNGGGVLVSGNTMQKGPLSENHGAFVIVGEEGITQRTPEIIVENNTATVDGGYPSFLLNNGTATEAVVRGNKLHGGSLKALKGDGSVK